MPSDTSTAKQTTVVLALMKRTAAGDVRWDATGDPHAYTSTHGGVVAMIEAAEATGRVRVRFTAVDQVAADTVVEQRLADGTLAKEDEYLNAMLRKLWTVVDGRINNPPSASDLFLRGDGDDDATAGAAG